MEGILRTRRIIWDVENKSGVLSWIFFLVKRYYPGFISWTVYDLKKERKKKKKNRELYKFTGCHGCLYIVYSKRWSLN